MNTGTLEKTHASDAQVEGRWNLGDLFAAHDDQRLWQTLDQAMQQALDFEKKFRGTIHVENGPSARHLREGLETLEALDELTSRVAAFAGLLFAEDTQNPQYQDLEERVEKKLTDLSNHLIFFDLEWLELDDAIADRLIGDPELRAYEHYLRHERAARPYRRSEPEEKILSKLRPTGVGAWQKIFTEITSSLRFPVTAHEGTKKQKVTMAEVLHRLHHPERAVRKEAMTTLFNVLSEEHVEHAIRFGYNNIIEDHLVRDEIRGYPSFMTARHISNETTDQMVQAMLSTVEAHYPLAHRYFRMKAKMLGLPKLALYDQYAPVGADTKGYDIDEARTTVLDAYNAFEPRFGQMVNEFFEKKWIDIFPRPGKRGGAFCYSPHPKMHPYVLTNFVGTARDVMTIAHELGHAVHGQLSRKQTPLNYHPPLTTCETASVFGESLTFDHMLAGLDEKQELSLLCGKIEDVFATVFRQTVLTRFEEKVYARRKDGLMTADELSGAWVDANKKYYGKAVQLHPGYKLGWSYIPHFVNSRFYCYSYVFGQLLTMALYRMYKDQGRSFVPLYVDLLSAGSSKSPSELFKPFGVDLADPGFWKRGFVEIEAMLSRAEELVGRLYKFS